MKRHKLKIVVIIMLALMGLVTVKSDSYADAFEFSEGEFGDDHENTEPPDNTPGIAADSATVSFPDPTSLYEIKSFSSECDISQNTPPGTTVINAMSAASITGAVDVAYKTAKQSYNVTFNCQMHYVAPKWDLHNEWENADYYENFSFTATLEASVAYQYIASVPQIYSFESMEIYNRLFPADKNENGMIAYSLDNLEIPHVSALFRIHSLQAETSTENYVQLSQNMALSDPYTYDYTPGEEGYHYSFYGENNITANVQIEGERAGDWSGITDAVTQKVTEIQSNISSGTWSCNDYAVIDDGSNTFSLMSDEKVYGVIISGTVNIIKNNKILGSIDAEFDSSTAASSQYQYGGAGYTLEEINTRCLASRITGVQSVSIADSSDSSDAPTGISIQYKNIFSSNKEHDISLKAGKHFFGDEADSIYEHVMSDGILAWHNGGDPDDGYPIRIQMSTCMIEIVDGLGHKAVEKTQLTPSGYNAEAENQLLLDNEYYIKWNNYGCASLVWDSPSSAVIEKFDKYVFAKYIRFPFDVVYNDTFFYTDETGYTEWIEVAAPDDWQAQWNSEINPDTYESANHWQMTPFYIPCFAQEGGGPGESMYVEAKIIMVSEMPADEDETLDTELTPVGPPDIDNSMEESEEDADRDEHESETDMAEESTKVQVQLSGWLYGLTIVGTDNGMVYTGSGLGEKNYEYMAYPMSAAKMEIKSGANNRLGTSSLRYLQDGSITGSYQPKLTLPLKNGSSLAFPLMGAVWKGQEVAFIVKTMANFTGNNDSIEIVPDIYFQKPDGEILSYKDGDIKIYVTDAIGNWSGIEYNPVDWDVSRGEKIALNDPLFQDCYYDWDDANGIQHGNWIQTTMERENLSRNTLELIPLTMQQYLERKVPTYSLNHISISSALRLFSGEYEQLKMNDGLMYDRISGTSTLKDYRGWINYSDNLTGEKVIHSMQQWHFKYSIPAYVKVIDVRNKGGLEFDLTEYINGQERWWWTSDPDVYVDKGSLIIQFLITAHKDGEPYLRYAADDGPYINMWEREGFCTEYPYGTVLIVDMSKSLNNYYIPAIQNIN